MSIESTAPTTSLFPSSYSAVLVKLPAPTLNSDPTILYSLIHRPAKPKHTLVLLHGYPQNHTLWHTIAAQLPLEDWNILIPDLPGYGRSTKSISTDGTHSNNSKKSVAKDIVALVDALCGSDCKFAIAGHDRGGRVAYKMAKDYSERISGVCLQDIVPTTTMFEAMRLTPARRHTETLGSYHWIFLALPTPLPETLINANPKFYFTHTIDNWTGARWKGLFDPLAMQSWIGQYDDPKVVLGALEDYRAGSSIDMDDDAQDTASERGGMVEMELLVLYSAHLGHRFEVQGVWKALAKGPLKIVKVGDEKTGHFLPIETDDTLKEMLEWMGRLQQK